MPTVLSRSIERPVRWRPTKLTWLAQLVEDPCGLFVRTDSPLRDLPGLLAAARKQPGGFSYDTAGIGGDDHIAALLLEKVAVRLNHIPFNGTSQILVPLLNGQLDVGASNLSEALPLLRNRAVRGIALAAPERDAAAPEILTYRESGVDLAFSADRGLFAPPKLPEPIRTAIEPALAAIFADPAWAETPARVGLILHPLIGTASPRSDARRRGASSCPRDRGPKSKNRIALRYYESAPIRSGTMPGEVVHDCRFQDSAA
ncbi:tripartite tricarboxylate transporter substrate-binding protein [Dankookia sp. P2]|uniref:tripartite tricarboxylate transporter substrate-binding protein n=1 Tax=Dankookia sp. P2 TaxID=3423955 RepID=UPI003D66C95D